ncbi:hypothetical protein [Streptomyces carpaticus]|uniref:hypothetical protein n=1 Tax=Streptomyces carpaticus TaxID=285558 RepID=UPI0031F9FD85
MAYPEDPLHMVVEAQIAAGGGFVDITGDALSRDQIRITRGRADEAAAVDPSRATLTLNNRDGRYSPRNPLGPYYGQLNRNTRIGVWVRGHDRYVRPTGAGGGAEAVGTPELSVAEDLDVAVEATLWRVPTQSSTWASQVQEIAARWAVPADRSWRIVVDAHGRPWLGWSPDGLQLVEAPATEPLPVRPEERMALRATLDVDNGSGGWTIRYYIAPSIDAAEAVGWRQLGEAVTGPGTTSVYNGAAPLEVGDIAAFSFSPGYGMYFRCQLRDGIGGHLLADLDARQLPAGATAWTDSVGRSWVRRTPSVLSDLYPRMLGEVVSWPTRWDVAGRDVWTPLEAAGPLRRLGAAGAKPLQSTLRRLIPTHTALRAYWPMEDGAESTSAAPGLTGGRTATTSGLEYATEAGLVSSAPLPTIGRSGAEIRVSLPGTGTPTGTGWRVDMVYRLDQVPGSQPALYEMLDLETSGGGIARITALLGPGLAGGGEARLVAYDQDDAIVGTGWWTDATAIAAAVSGWCRVRITCVPVTGGYAYRMWWTRIGVGENWYTGTTALPNYTVPTRINTSWPAALAGMPVGHITYVNSNTISVYGEGSGAADDALRGEHAVARVRRLAQEERLLFASPGLVTDSARVGPQRIDTVLGLVREAAEADGGLLYELRGTRGLHYMPRYLLYDRPPDLVLDYAAGHIAEPLEPQPDDFDVINDLEVSRPGGGRGRAVQEDGPLSVADPPAGIGRYDATAERNLFADSQLEPAAAWSVHQATRPEERWPMVRIDMAAPGITPADRQAILDRLDVGAVVRIVGTPPWVAPGPVDLLVEGYTEEIGHPNDWLITLNCSPASRWRTGQVVPERPGDETAPVHVDTDGSQLAASAGPDDTTVSVIATVGPSWTTDPTDTPFDVAIGGERMTVTAVGEPGGGSWAGAGDRHEGQDSRAATAPPVDGPGLLICCWQGFGQPAGAYALPSEMTAGPQVAGQYARSAAAWESVGPGPSGARAAIITGEPDAWSAISVRATGGAVAGHWAAHGNQTATSVTTASATVGQWLLAICGWDWDPGGLMPAPTAGAWTLVAESGGATSSTSRLRAWARQVTTAGAQVVSMAAGTNVFDVHLRVFLLGGVPSSAAQPFTVQRAVNGIAKGHTAGADVRLADPMIVGL